MPTLVLRFPGGRYHATPGAHHVNEGLVEWPPSPWRLVRALIACGYTTQHWSEVPPPGRRLVEALSSVLPEYRLPPASLGHSRHYMPTTKMKNGREETTLVLDTFADVGEGALWVRWPIDLDPEASELFSALGRHLGYLGRSESWVLGESVSDDVSLPEHGRAFAHSEELRPSRRFEQITLTAAERPDRYAEWRRSEIDAAIEVSTTTSAKKQSKKKLEAIEGAYPRDIVDCMQRDTAWWKAHKWSQAPGTRSVLYWREADALEVGTPVAPRTVRADRVEMMLLALTTPSGSRSALPTVARTLPQAELLHKALVSKLGYGGEPCPELVGRDTAGAPLTGHRHAHILPVDLDRDGHLDHVVVFACMGLGSRAQRAIQDLRRTYMKGGVGELQIATAGRGRLEDLRSLGGTLSASIAELLGRSSTWTSSTPFVPPRHPKKAGRSSLVGQVEAELERRGFPSAAVEILGPQSMRHFVRRRQRGPQPPIDAGFAVQLRFDRPVPGPICIGYGSHFGLGRFAAT